jgi:uncharacterized cupin superfamily protein
MRPPTPTASTASGSARVRKVNTNALEPGDAFIFKPGEAHQITSDAAQDLVLYVVADNPYGESTHFPDSGKWVVRSPVRAILRSESLDYYDGEE